MSKISRADSKARFRTGMYPTQADFENLHDSYVHKDDTIPLEQVGTNGATVVSLLNQKANSSHTHEIADVNGLQTFINKVNTFLDTVDASDDTINRWKEIEEFLTGITDTQTLAGMLANLRTEIVALIPEADNKAYLQLVSDLDAYTDAPVGTIVKYTGQTNDKYTHGWDYERKAGEEIVLPANSQRLHLVNLQIQNGEEQDLNGWYVPTEDTLTYCLPDSQNTAIRVYGLPLDATSQYVQPGSYFETLGEVTEVYESGYTKFASGRGFTASQMERVNDVSNQRQSTIWQNVQTGEKIIIWSNYTSDIYQLVSTVTNDTILATDGAVITAVYKGISTSGSEQNTIWNAPQDSISIGGSPASWQPCKPMSVID